MWNLAQVIPDGMVARNRYYSWCARLSACFTIPVGLNRFSLTSQLETIIYFFSHFEAFSRDRVGVKYWGIHQVNDGSPRTVQYIHTVKP